MDRDARLWLRLKQQMDRRDWPSLGRQQTGMHVGDAAGKLRDRLGGEDLVEMKEQQRLGPRPAQRRDGRGRVRIA